MADYSKDDGKSHEEVQAKFWTDELANAKKVMEHWQERGDKTVSRYRDERATASEGSKAKFNILWSNVQILTPSLYGRPAKPEVSRRFMDRDPVGRLASTILERVLAYEVEQFPEFDEAMRGAVEDRLLPGRGTIWVRLDQDIATQISDKSYSPTDYVYWKDFVHSPARTWEEVSWVARWVYLTQEEVIARFGEEHKDVPLEEYQQDNSKGGSQNKSSYAEKAKVAEIWNKETRKVCWIAEGYPLLLDEKDDPLKLEGFFPCPKPLYATMTQGSLIPVPDYCEYQDQADELDSVTQQITELVKSIKAIGVYNSEFKELSRLFSSKGNTMIPVSNWAAFAEKHGLKGAIDLLDLSTQQSALSTLYASREQIKLTIYEICGISDILRGQTKAEETLGAQQLKANFGSLRLRSSQVDVARFAGDVFKLKAQIICEFYPPELIIQMSGVAESAEAQSPDYEQLLTAALSLLKDSKTRDFQINVESDSLAQVDEQEEKAAAAEAIMAIGGFLKEAIPMVSQAPETLPMASEMLLFLVRRFRAGRGLEFAIENAMRALQQKAIQAQMNPPPSEAQIEAQAQAQSDAMRMQMETQAHQMKTASDSQTQKDKLEWEGRLETLKSEQEKQLARLEGQLKLAIENMHDETERFKAILDAETKLEIARMNRDAQLQAAEMTASTQMQTAELNASTQMATTEKKAETDTRNTETTTNAKATNKELPELKKRVEELVAMSKQKKRKKVIRDKDDKIVGVEEESVN